MTEYGRRGSGIELEFSASPHGVVIDADRDLVSQVIVNLLLNAQQVLVERPHPRRIGVSVEAQTDGVIISVGDNGPGIPPHIASKIFEPYFTTKAVGAGTGIGLSISRTFVEAHGGQIDFQTRLDEGTCFQVRLPYHAIPQPHTSHVDEKSTPLNLLTLIIDDEVDVAHSLSEIVQKLGHRTHVTNSALFALGELNLDDFNIIFVDLRMPDISGAEFFKAVLGVNPALAQRIIVMTGDTEFDRGAIRCITKQGGAIILEKPFTAADVEASIRRSISFL
jgi:CheY-like chemotaxis protein